MKEIEDAVKALAEAVKHMLHRLTSTEERLQRLECALGHEAERLAMEGCADENTEDGTVTRAEYEALLAKENWTQNPEHPHIWYAPGSTPRVERGVLRAPRSAVAPDGFVTLAGAPDEPVVIIDRYAAPSARKNEV